MTGEDVTFVLPDYKPMSGFPADGETHRTKIVQIMQIARFITSTSAGSGYDSEIREISILTADCKSSAATWMHVMVYVNKFELFTFLSWYILANVTLCIIYDLKIHIELR